MSKGADPSRTTRSGAAARPVGIPETLDGTRPIGELLDFIQDQYEALSGALRLQPGGVPLPDQPVRVSLLRLPAVDWARIVSEARRGIVRLVDCEVAAWKPGLRERLLHDGGLAGLAGPEDGDHVLGIRLQKLTD